MELRRNLIRFPNSVTISKLLHRTCMSDSNDFQDESMIENDKKKGKVVAIKKSFHINTINSPVILEAKDASTVIKKLNWQFKMLYGELQSAKSSNAIKKLKNTFKINDSIIQNEPVFPILDPKSVESSEPDTRNSANENYHWQTLLKFPLVNRQSPALHPDLEINNINSLRKLLEEKSKTYVPSVSKILEKTMPPEQAETLRRWKENMIKEMGEEKFQKQQEETLSKGHTFHMCINNYLANVPRSEIEIEEAIAGHWESLKEIFPAVSDVKLLEERITHPFLRYKGIVDCFARYKGSLVVIDWKTSKKKKLTLSSTFDNPLQIAAYVGALNFDPKYQYLADKGLIVVAYPDGSRASVHFMDESVMRRYWKAWLARVKLYWELTEKEESRQS